MAEGHTKETRRWHRWGWVLALLCLPLPLLIIGAWCRPDVYLLAGQGWMVWHDPQNLPDSLMLRQDQLRFLRVFLEEIQPAEALLRLRVLGDPVVTLNGVVLPAQASRLHWKQSLTYDLQKAWRRGENTLIIDIHGQAGKAAMQVLSPASWCAAENWKVQRDDEPPLPAMAPGQGAMPVGVVSQWMGGQSWQWLAWFWLIGWGIAGILAGSRLFPMSRDMSMDGRSAAGWKWPALLVVLVMLFVHGWNLVYLDAGRGPDAQGHIAHIQQVARTWTPALATDGWQAYQPPAYYFTAAGIYQLLGGQAHHDRAIKGVQALGVICALLLITITWGWLKHDSNMGGIAGRYHWQGIMIVAALPLVAGNAPLVNNEMFSAMVVGAALLLSIRALTRPQFSTIGAVTLGLVWGLAMLCKFTALIPLLAVSVTFIQRGFTGSMNQSLAACEQPLSRSQAYTPPWRSLVLMGLMLLAVAGWFYLRNLWHFGTAFHGNWQAFPAWFPPGVRWPSFYLRWGDFLGHDIDWLMWSSFWDSIYRTFWAGDRGLFVSRWMVQANVLLMLLMLVGWPVMVTLVLGWWISLRSAIHDWGTAPGRLSLLWVLLTGWTLCSLLWFSLVIAAWGSTTARYLLYLVPALAVLWVRGRAGWQGRLGWVGRCADACLCGMVLLVVMVYRFGGWRA